METITRKERFIQAAIDGAPDSSSPITRIELYLAKIAGADVKIPVPITRREYYLASIAGMDVVLPQPVTREDLYLAAIAGMDVKVPEPIRRIEYLLADWAENGLGYLIKVRGIPPLTLATALAKPIKSLVRYGKCTVSDGVITCNNGVLSVSGGEIITTGTAEEVRVTHSDSTTETVSDIPNLYAVEDIVDEVDIITGKTIRRTEATLYDSSNPPVGRFIGNATDGSVIVQARETVYEDDAVATFTAEEETPLNLVKAEFAPVQDLHGYDSPWPAGGGKNKLDYADFTNSYRITSVTDDGNGTFTVVASGTYAYIDYLIDVTANETYVIKCESVRNVSGNASQMEIVNVYDGADTTAAKLLSNQSIVSQKTFVPTGNKILVRMAVTGGSGSGTGEIVKPQLELGSTATPWTPYSNECPIEGWTGVDIMHSGEDVLDYDTIPITWTDEAGTVYGGYLRINRDGSVDITAITSGVDMGTIIFSVTSSVSSVGGTVFTVGLSSIGQGMKARANNTAQEVLSDVFAPCASNINYVASMPDFAMMRGASAFFVSDSRYLTAADFRASVNGVFLTYPLATPVTYHLPSIDALKSYDGINHVWHSANGKITVALADADVIEQNTPHPLTTSEGTNTVDAYGEMKVEYRASEEPVLSMGMLNASLNNALPNALDTMVSTDEPLEEITLDDLPKEDLKLEKATEEPEVITLSIEPDVIDLSAPAEPIADAPVERSMPIAADAPAEETAEPVVEVKTTRKRRTKKKTAEPETENKEVVTE